MGGVGICYVNTFLVKVEAFPEGTPLTISLLGKFLVTGSSPPSACVLWENGYKNAETLWDVDRCVTLPSVVENCQAWQTDDFVFLLYMKHIQNKDVSHFKLFFHLKA